MASKPPRGQQRVAQYTVAEAHKEMVQQDQKHEEDEIMRQKLISGELLSEGAPQEGGEVGLAAKAALHCGVEGGLKKKPFNEMDEIISGGLSDRSRQLIERHQHRAKECFTVLRESLAVAVKHDPQNVMRERIEAVNLDQFLAEARLRAHLEARKDRRHYQSSMLQYERLNMFESEVEKLEFHQLIRDETEIENEVKEAAEALGLVNEDGTWKPKCGCEPKFKALRGKAREDGLRIAKIKYNTAYVRELDRMVAFIDEFMAKTLEEEQARDREISESRQRQFTLVTKMEAQQKLVERLRKKTGPGAEADARDAEAIRELASMKEYISHLETDRALAKTTTSPQSPTNAKDLKRKHNREKKRLQQALAIEEKLIMRTHDLDACYEELSSPLSASWRKPKKFADNGAQTLTEEDLYVEHGIVPESMKHTGGNDALRDSIAKVQSPVVKTDGVVPWPEEIPEFEGSVKNMLTLVSNAVDLLDDGRVRIMSAVAQSCPDGSDMETQLAPLFSHTNSVARDTCNRLVNELKLSTRKLAEACNRSVERSFFRGKDTGKEEAEQEAEEAQARAEEEAETQSEHGTGIVVTPTPRKEAPSKTPRSQGTTPRKKEPGEQPPKKTKPHATPSDHSLKVPGNGAGASKKPPAKGAKKAGGGTGATPKTENIVVSARGPKSPRTPRTSSPVSTGSPLLGAEGSGGGGMISGESLEQINELRKNLARADGQLAVLRDSVVMAGRALLKNSVILLRRDMLDSLDSAKNGNIITSGAIAVCQSIHKLANEKQESGGAPHILVEASRNLKKSIETVCLSAVEEGFHFPAFVLPEIKASPKQGSLSANITSEELSVLLLQKETHLNCLNNCVAKQFPSLLVSAVNPLRECVTRMALVCKQFADHMATTFPQLYIDDPVRLLQASNAELLNPAAVQQQGEDGRETPGIPPPKENSAYVQLGNTVADAMDNLDYFFREYAKDSRNRMAAELNRQKAKIESSLQTRMVRPGDKMRIDSGKAEKLKAEIQERMDEERRRYEEFAREEQDKLAQLKAEHERQAAEGQREIQEMERLNEAIIATHNKRAAEAVDTADKVVESEETRVTETVAEQEHRLLEAQEKLFASMMQRCLSGESTERRALEQMEANAGRALHETMYSLLRKLQEGEEEVQLILSRKTSEMGSTTGTLPSWEESPMSLAEASLRSIELPPALHASTGTPLSPEPEQSPVPAVSSPTSGQVGGAAGTPIGIADDSPPMAAELPTPTHSQVELNVLTTTPEGVPVVGATSIPSRPHATYRTLASQTDPVRILPATLSERAAFAQPPAAAKPKEPSAVSASSKRRVTVGGSLSQSGEETGGGGGGAPISSSVGTVDIEVQTFLPYPSVAPGTPAAAPPAAPTAAPAAAPQQTTPAAAVGIPTTGSPVGEVAPPQRVSLESSLSTVPSPTAEGSRSLSPKARKVPTVTVCTQASMPASPGSGISPPDTSTCAIQTQGTEVKGRSAQTNASSQAETRSISVQTVPTPMSPPARTRARTGNSATTAPSIEDSIRDHVGIIKVDCCSGPLDPIPMTSECSTQTGTEAADQQVTSVEVEAQTDVSQKAVRHVDRDMNAAATVTTAASQTPAAFMKAAKASLVSSILSDESGAFSDDLSASSRDRDTGGGSPTHRQVQRKSPEPKSISRVIETVADVKGEKRKSVVHTVIEEAVEDDEEFVPPDPSAEEPKGAMEDQQSSEESQDESSESGEEEDAVVPVVVKDSAVPTADGTKAPIEEVQESVATTQRNDTVPPKKLVRKKKTKSHGTQSVIDTEGMRQLLQRPPWSREQLDLMAHTLASLNEAYLLLVPHGSRLMSAVMKPSLSAWETLLNELMDYLRDLSSVSRRKSNADNLLGVKRRHVMTQTVVKTVARPAQTESPMDLERLLLAEETRSTGNHSTFSNPLSPLAMHRQSVQTSVLGSALQQSSVPDEEEISSPPPAPPQRTMSYYMQPSISEAAEKMLLLEATMDDISLAAEDVHQTLYNVLPEVFKRLKMRKDVWDPFTTQAFGAEKTPAVTLLNHDALVLHELHGLLLQDSLHTQRKFSATAEQALVAKRLAQFVQHRRAKAFPEDVPSVAAFLDRQERKLRTSLEQFTKLKRRVAEEKERALRDFFLPTVDVGVMSYMPPVLQRRKVYGVGPSHHRVATPLEKDPSRPSHKLQCISVLEQEIPNHPANAIRINKGVFLKPIEYPLLGGKEKEKDEAGGASTPPPAASSGENVPIEERTTPLRAKSLPALYKYDGEIPEEPVDVAVRGPRNVRLEGKIGGPNRKHPESRHVVIPKRTTQVHPPRDFFLQPLVGKHAKMFEARGGGLPNSSVTAPEGAKTPPPKASGSLISGGRPPAVPSPLSPGASLGRR